MFHKFGLLFSPLTAIVVPEEAAPSTSDVEEETEESTPMSSGRGVARKNVPRARGRRAAAARVRVVSTRIHGGRRNPILPPTIDTEENNATLEETVSTETEESPKKTIATPKVEEKKSKKSETVTPSQINTDSNVRVSGKRVFVITEIELIDFFQIARIKERVSTGRNRQFPYTDDYVDLDNIEKQSKANTTTTTTTPGRKSNRGRPSASPQKRISLRQQPIDASESLAQNDKTDIYDKIDTVAEKKEPTPQAAGRKRKSTTPVSAVATKKKYESINYY